MLAPQGEEVPSSSTYWRRRLLRGDVLLAPENPEPEPVQAPSADEPQPLED
mgnify:CR=1 FL=1